MSLRRREGKNVKISEAHNMVRYVQTEMRTFEEKPFTEVDSLVLSWLCYLYIHEDFSNSFSPDGMPIRDLLKAEYFEEMLVRQWDPEVMLDLLVATVSSPRFRDLRVRYYRYETDHRINLQFSATVFSLSENAHYVAYRGTDWSITGWKEDLLLALKDPAPAQKMAVDYLNSIGKRLKGELIIGGHSKGGNLSVFAAAMCDAELQDRITAVYSHDGPGFSAEDLRRDPFLKIRDRIRKTVPEASYFGMLFEHEVPVKVIRSTGVSVMQHKADTWVIEDGELVEGNQHTVVSHFVSNRMNRWISAMTQTEKAEFIDAVFAFLEQVGIKTIDEIDLNPVQLLPGIGGALNRMDKKQREYIRRMLGILLKGKKPGKNEETEDWDPEDEQEAQDLKKFGEEYRLFI